MPNSLWQMDHTEEDDGSIRFPVLDDCSRYLPALVHWDTITTKRVTRLLDELIRIYGAPRQILTDNALCTVGSSINGARDMGSCTSNQASISPPPWVRWRSSTTHTRGKSVTALMMRTSGTATTPCDPTEASMERPLLWSTTSSTGCCFINHGRRNT